MAYILTDEDKRIAQNLGNQQFMQMQQAQAAQAQAAQPKKGAGILGAILSTAGGALGGIAGSFIAPVAGTVAGGALGSAGGQALANLLTGNKVGDDVVEQGLFGAIPGVGGLIGKGAKLAKGVATATRVGGAADTAAAAAVGALKPGGSILSRVGSGIENTGNKLMASQANLTRAQARDFAAGGNTLADTFGNLQKRTGIGDMATLDKLGSMITGKDGIVSNRVRMALDPVGVDLSTLPKDAAYALSTRAPGVLGAQRKNIIGTLKQSVDAAYGGDAGSISSVVGGGKALTIQQQLAEHAADASKAFARNGDPANKQIGDVYRSLSNNIKDKLTVAESGTGNFAAQKKGIVQDMIESAEDLRGNGQKSLGDAMDKLARKFRSVTTITDARAFQKDFVDLNKVFTKSAQAEFGAADRLGNQMQGLGRIAQKPLDAIALPLNAQSGRVGSVLSNFGRRLQGQAADGGIVDAATGAAGAAKKFTGRTVLKALAAQGVPRALLGGYGGGDAAAMDGEISPEMAAALQGGADMSQLTPDQVTQAGVMGADGQPATNLVDGQGNPIASSIPKENIDAAILDAATKGDADNVKLLMSLSQYFYPQGDATTDKQQIAAQSAGATVDQLEQLLGKTGAQGNGVLANIFGGAQSLAGDAGLDDNARSYNSFAGSAATQIAKAVGGQTGALSDQDIKRAMDALPKLTDSDAVRKQKIASLRAQIAAAQSAGTPSANTNALAAVLGG